MNRNAKAAKAFIAECEATFGVSAVIDRTQIQSLVDERNVPYPYWLVTKPEYRSGRGKYQVPSLGLPVKKEEPVQETSEDQPDMVAQVVPLRQHKLVEENHPAIPLKHPDYVPFGFYSDLKKIIAAKIYYPVFITGLSGNGKTLMVEQICHALGRELIRVNISIETDESDLLGGPTLVDGNVVNRDGPVLIAMRRGAVLLIDEVDRGSNKLMCLQGILEGKPYFNKKTGETVYPAEGFNAIATANTKGRGSDEGKYLSQILDDAFLERFPITVEQEYPSAAVEKKILSPLISDAEFVDNLVKWADIIRKTYDSGGIDEIISTRRLVHIAKAFSIFKDRMKAIELCVARFDTDTKVSLIDLYTKVTNSPVVAAEAVPVSPPDPDEIPF